MATGVENQVTPKKGKGPLLMMVLVAVVSLAAGFAVPRLLLSDAPKTPSKSAEAMKPAVVSFSDIVVNLGEERLNRYLRAKIVLVIDGDQEKSITDHLGKQKAYLKSWLIGYLSDLTLQDVSRAAGVNRVRREIRDQFNAMLFPDGSELVLEVLFDEFVVQ